MSAAAIRVEDRDRVRCLTLDRPEKLNAFSEALYDAAAEALIDAAADPTVAVTVITGAGRAFSAGVDVFEMGARNTDDWVPGKHGFPGLIDQLAAFPKPLVCAVNGLAVGVGVTMLGFADLVFMSTEARVRAPFTDLGVAPEAASSFNFPRLVGRQNASWMLLSGAWLSAEECERIGLAWRLCAPEDLLEEALEHARVIASKPMASLIETKRTLVGAVQAQIAAARERENTAFARLMGSPANVEALRAFAGRRTPDFVSIDAEFPVDIDKHASP